MRDNEFWETAALVSSKGASEMIIFRMDGVSERNSDGVQAKLKGVSGPLRCQKEDNLLLFFS